MKTDTDYDKLQLSTVLFMCDFYNLASGIYP